MRKIVKAMMKRVLKESVCREPRVVQSGNGAFGKNTSELAEETSSGGLEPHGHRVMM